MKKKLWIFFILLILGGIILIALNNSNPKEGYVAKKIGTNIVNIAQKTMSEFTTKLPNDTEARDNNIKLACKTLNGSVIKSGESFSFWEVIGCPSEKTGYEKAKTFTTEGETIQSYGGGVCQVSTTIYNAVLDVEGLKITERHEHSKDVPYIEDGKDAAVAYPSSDLKFKNTLDYDIRIDAEVEDRKVKITLVRI